VSKDDASMIMVFSRKWHFIALVGVLLLGAAVGVYYWRNSQLTREVPVVDVASKPIPQNPSAKTQNDIREMGKQWYERNMLEAYEKVGIHDESWDSAARELIQAHILIASRSPEAQERDNLAPIAEKIVRLKCTDPLILYLAATFTPGLEAQVRILEESISRFRGSSYSKGLAFRTAHFLEACYEQLKMSQKQTELDETLLELLKEVVQEKSYRNEEWSLRIGWPMKKTTSDFFIRKADAVYQILEESPFVDKWVIETVKGYGYLEQAWKEFDEYKKSHSAEEWTEVRRKMKPVEEHFRKAYQLEPSQPFAAAGMVWASLVAAENPREKLREWFEKAIGAQFDFPMAYGIFANGISPRWYGSDQDLLNFGYQCLETKRFDTDVPNQYIRTVVNLGYSTTPENHYTYFVDPDVYTNCKRTFEGYLAAEVQKDAKPYYHSQYAIVAYHAGAYEDSLRNLKAVDFKLNPRALRSWKNDFSGIADEVSAFTGDAQNQIYDAEKFFQKRESQNAMKHYEEALEIEKDERAIRYIRNRLGLLRFEQELDKGDWVKFIPSQDLKGWSVDRGKWSVLANDVLQVQSGFRGSMIKSLGRVGSNFEIHGEIELVSSSNGAYEAGVVFGYPAEGKKEWMSFRIENHSEKGNLVSLSQGFYVPFKEGKAQLSLRNRFFLQVWNEKITAYVNGKLLFKNEIPPREFYRMTDDCLVGLGGYFDHNETTIRYHNLRLRKLTGPPEEPEFDLSTGKLKLN
jgi:hypothetical protein